MSRPPAAVAGELPHAGSGVRFRDFSWGYLGMFASGVALWAVYGALRRDLAVLGANVVTIVLVIGVIVVKLRE